MKECLQIRVNCHDCWTPAYCYSVLWSCKNDLSTSSTLFTNNQAFHWFWNASEMNFGFQNQKTKGTCYIKHYPLESAPWSCFLALVLQASCAHWCQPAPIRYVLFHRENKLKLLTIKLLQQAGSYNVIQDEDLDNFSEFSLTDFMLLPGPWNRITAFPASQRSWGGTSLRVFHSLPVQRSTRHSHRTAAPPPGAFTEEPNWAGSSSVPAVRRSGNTEPSTTRLHGTCTGALQSDHNSSAQGRTGGVFLRNSPSHMEQRIGSKCVQRFIEKIRMFCT